MNYMYSLPFNLNCGQIDLLREMLFADDAALVTHSEVALQKLSHCFADACKQFGLTISLKKTNVCTKDVNTLANITIDGVTMENVDTFTYLGSTTSNTVSLTLNWTTN